MDVPIRESAPASLTSNADYHRRRAARERELAMRADDPSAMRAHAKLAELHEARAGSGPMQNAAA